MSLFKPKGKHAQGAHAQPVVIRPEEVEATEEADSETPESASDETGQIAEAVPDADQTALIEPADIAAAGKPTADGASYGYNVPNGDTGDYPGQPAPEFAVDGFAAITPDGVVLHKKRRVGKVLGITFGIIIGLLLIAYIAGAVVFMGRFFPRTSILGNDISMMTNDEVIAIIDKTAKDYEITVVGTDFNYHATAGDLNLTVDSEGIVEAMHADLNAWTWPVLIFQDEHDESGALAVSFKAGNYESQVTKAIEEYNKEATAPTDATIGYDEKTKKFKVVNEIAGTQYDAKTVLAAMDEAISALEPRVKLTSDFLVQPKVLANDERLINSAELATGLVSAHVTLTMAGQHAVDIDSTQLSQFIHIDENFGVSLDEGALNQWAIDLTNGLDTVGTERTYTRPDGKVITISGGAYGWLTDGEGFAEQLLAAIKTGETTTIDIPCQQTAAVYNGPGQPDWGNRYIDVDLSEQYVRFYGDDGSIIWESACISGTPDGKHNTWPGVWYITNKESPSKLIGYTDSGQKEYETTVQYWMAFEGNGIGLHDATWQPYFGGDMYMSGYGSHGCVNLSYGAAESLYGICEWGDVVIAHY